MAIPLSDLPRRAQSGRHHAPNRHAVREEKKLALPRGTVPHDEDMALAAHGILLRRAVGNAADENKQHAELHLQSVSQTKQKRDRDHRETGKSCSPKCFDPRMDASESSNKTANTSETFESFLMFHLSSISYHPSEIGRYLYRPPVAQTIPRRS